MNVLLFNLVLLNLQFSLFQGYFKSIVNCQESQGKITYQYQPFPKHKSHLLHMVLFTIFIFTLYKAELFNTLLHAISAAL